MEPKGLGIETSAIRHGGLTGQASSAAWKAVGAETHGNRVLSPPPVSWKVKPGGPGAPFEADASLCGLAIDTSAFHHLCGQARWPARPHKPRLAWFDSTVRFHSGDASKDRWCGRGAVNAVPLRQEVQFRPSPTTDCGHSSMAEHRVANATTRVRFPLTSLIRGCSSSVERQVEALRVGSSILPFLTMIGDSAGAQLILARLTGGVRHSVSPPFLFP